MTLRNIAALMRHPRAPRIAVVAGNVLACSTLVGFVACSDSGLTGPAAPRSTAAVRANVEYAPPGTGWTKDFTYVPSEGTTVYLSGGGKIVLPAYSICTTNSGYGAALWNSSCTAATSPMTFHVVTSLTSAGSPQFTVTPDVRFVPGKVAQLYIPAPSGSATNAPVIMWCPTGAAQCVNEGVSDPTLVTSFSAATQLAERRIKHFSGYNVSYGKSGGPGQNGQ